MLMRDAAGSNVARRAYLRLCLLAAGSAAVLAGWLGTGLGGPTCIQTVDNVALCLAPLAAAVASVARGRRTAGRVRWSWWLLGAASLSWALGSLVWTWDESVLGREVPFPSLADAGYLALPVLMT